MTCSPAKINLALHVVGQRDDGYHVLDSVVCFTEFGDQIHIKVNENAKAIINFEKSGPFANSLCDDANNLIVSAATALYRKLNSGGIDCLPVSISLQKNLPISSGMGGGSSNAAQVLNILKEHWIGDRTYDLGPLALELGADVAMCLDNKPKRVGGIGDIISPFHLPIPIPLVLVNPMIEVPTPTVFSALENKTNSPISYSEANFVNLEQLITLLDNQRNDLQLPAIQIMPEIGEALSCISNANGCLFSRMTGSGGTCFGIFPDLVSAESASRKIIDSRPDWWSIATKTVTSVE